MRIFNKKGSLIYKEKYVEKIVENNKEKNEESLLEKCKENCSENEPMITVESGFPPAQIIMFSLHNL